MFGNVVLYRLPSIASSQIIQSIDYTNFAHVVNLFHSLCKFLLYLLIMRVTFILITNLVFYNYKKKRNLVGHGRSKKLIYLFTCYIVKIVPSKLIDTCLNINTAVVDIIES